MALADVVGHQIVDLSNDANYYFEVAPQGDSQSRAVEVRLLNNGVPYPIPAHTTAILEGKNAGGYNIFNSCTISEDYENSIVIPFSNGVLSYAGVGKYAVALYDTEGEWIISFSFNIVVTEAPYDMARLQASDSYEALNKAISQALSSNRWWVENGEPYLVVPYDFNKGDYYLNALNGDVFYADYNSSDVLSWSPLLDSHGTQVNIMQKVHIRYSNDSSGSSMTKDPTGKKYIGFYVSVTKDDDTDPTHDVNIPSNYSWSVISNVMDATNTYTLYAIGDDDVTAPTSWSRNIPPVAPGKYLWTKVHIAFYTGDVAEYMSVTKYGMNAGFDDPAATATILATGGKSSINVTDSGDFTEKSFNFDFHIRASEWKIGTLITGSGTQTSTDFTDINTIVGDMYINTDTGESYRCSAVTESNSTWEESISFTVVSTPIDDLNNTLRHYGVLNPGQENLVINGSSSMYTKADAEGNMYYYHIKYLTSVQAVLPNKPNPVIITDGEITTTLTFKNMNMDNMKVTPDGTENPYTLGWYEKTGVKTYAPTSDTTVVSGKDYYTPVLICMEVIKKSS